MKKHIYLFRHGQTHFNKDHKFTGWYDSKLTEKGVKDAKKVAELLKDKEFQAAFQTTLSRSIDTLKHVLKYHPECSTIITDDRMIERSYGDLQEHSHKEIIDKVGKEQFDIWHRSYDTPPPEGESIKDVETRVLPFIEDLLMYMQDNEVNVAISAHGNSMRPFRRYFENLSVEKMMKLENPWDDYFDYTINFKK